MRLHLFLHLLILHVICSYCSIISDYEECSSKDWGVSDFVCDLDGLLANSTKTTLNSLLLEMQKRIKCQCENGCKRDNGNDKYIGLLLVTTSDKVQQANMSLNESSDDIYYKSQLGNEQCDNGLLIIYIKDKKQLATNRGSGSFLLLKPEHMTKLHNEAKKHALGDDTLAIQYLISNYENVVMRPDIQRAETWTPVIGLSIALIIVLLILALLLALFFARFCCCCTRTRKKDVYHVTTIPTYKTIEPLFVATPPHSDRVLGPQSDVIYSTPYSGTPIPPPHFAPPRPDAYFGSMRSATASQSVTPVSTHKHRIRPSHGPIPKGFTPGGTPTMRSRLGSSRVDDSTQTNGTPPTEPNRSGERSSISGGAPQGNGQALPRSPDTVSIPRSVGYAESDLSFLDPRRRLEVQTRTDYIY